MGALEMRRCRYMISGIQDAIGRRGQNIEFMVDNVRRRRVIDY